MIHMELQFSLEPYKHAKFAADGVDTHDALRQIMAQAMPLAAVYPMIQADIERYKKAYGMM